MSNPWAKFAALFPEKAAQLGWVRSYNNQGQSIIELRDTGQMILANGTQTAVGKLVYVQNGQIQGEAPPDQPVYQFEV